MNETSNNELIKHLICENCYKRLKEYPKKSEILGKKGNRVKVKQISEICFNCFYCNEMHKTEITYIKFLEKKNSCCLIF